MREVPRSVVEAYSGQIDSISKEHRKYLTEALEAVDWSRPIAEVREQIISAMHIWCGGATDLAALVAAELYDGLRELMTGEPMGANATNTRVPEATEGAVRAFVQDFVKGRSPDEIIHKCLGRLDLEVRRAANECIAQNSITDPKRPRWARVPSGAETCKFCIMLAGRGFKYHSKELAHHAHSNCDCHVIPGWKGCEAVEGYDSDYWKRIWERLDNATVIHESLYDENPAEVTEQRNELNERIRVAWNDYTSRGSTDDAYRITVGKLVEGLTSSGRLTVEPGVDIKKRGHEPHLAMWFANAGHRIRLRKPRDDGDTNDSVMDDEVWEFKRLTTKSTKKFKRRITEKLPRQGPNFIVDLSEGGLDRDSAEMLIADLLEDENIEKIILVKSGTAKLFRK